MAKPPINADVDVLRVQIDSEEEAEAHLLRWIVSEEIEARAGGGCDR